MSRKQISPSPTKNGIQVAFCKQQTTHNESMSFFEEEKDEAGNKERKGENNSCSGVFSRLSLCHRSTVPVGKNMDL